VIPATGACDFNHNHLSMLNPSDTGRLESWTGPRRPEASRVCGRNLHYTQLNL